MFILEILKADRIINYRYINITNLTVTLSYIILYDIIQKFRFRLASIMEESPELMTNAPPVRTEERLRARVQRRRNSINEQSIDIVNEARRTVFSRRPTLTK